MDSTLSTRPLTRNAFCPLCRFLLPVVRQPLVDDIISDFTSLDLTQKPKSSLCNPSTCFPVTATSPTVVAPRSVRPATDFSLGVSEMSPSLRALSISLSLFSTPRSTPTARRSRRSSRALGTRRVEPECVQQMCALLPARHYPPNFIRLALTAAPCTSRFSFIRMFSCLTDERDSDAGDFFFSFFFNDPVVVYLWNPIGSPFIHRWRPRPANRREAPTSKM